MPSLAQRIQDDSSSNGSTSDTSFNLGPPPPLIQRNRNIFDSSDDNSYYSDDSATMPLSVSAPIADSCIIAFFFLLRSCEYTTAPESNQRQTIPF